MPALLAQKKCMTEITSEFNQYADTPKSSAAPHHP
jgi:hypothetical protein